MANITIYRDKDFFLSLFKWKIYIDGKLISNVKNGNKTSFSLPSGTYELMINCPDFLIPFRKKGLHSNTINIIVEDEQEYLFNVCSHPLSWWGKHHPDGFRPYKTVECLLLLQQNEYFQDNYERIEQIGKEIQNEIKIFNYHPFSIVLIISISLFTIISSIIYPELYSIGDGIAWGFLFGITNLMGLFVAGKDKGKMARGWEHKFLLYTAFGALMILLFIPSGYFWQSVLFLIFVLFDCFWAYHCYKQWKIKKKGLDKIEKMELVIEGSL